MKCNGCGANLGINKFLPVVTDGKSLFIICPVCDAKKHIGTFIEEKQHTNESLNELEKELLTLVGRLYDEDPSTFAPETYEVMKKWKPIFTKRFLKGGLKNGE